MFSNGSIYSLIPGQSVDISSNETSIHTVAALLKDMLRSVPGGILLSSRYTEFVATNDIKDVGIRAHNIQKYVLVAFTTPLFSMYIWPVY